MNVLLLSSLSLPTAIDSAAEGDTRECGGGGPVQKFNLGLLPHISDVLVNLIASTEVSF